MKYLVSLFLLSWTGMIGVGQICLQLDSSFGIQGKAIGSTNGFRSGAMTRTLFVQSDNKIIQLAEAHNEVNSGIGLIRYHPNGEQDLSFGTNGSVFTVLGNQFFQPTYGAIQNDDKLLVAGTLYENGSLFALVRFNKNGGIDDRFGTGGLVKIPVGLSNAYANGMALQPDGKIILVGSCLDFQNTYSIGIVRILQNGNIDPGFGNEGKLIVHLGPLVTDPNDPLKRQYSNEYAKDVLIQPDGKIIVSGVSYSLGNCYPDYYGGIYCSPGFAMARYHPNGGLDTTFGNSGMFIDSVLSDYNSFPVLLDNGKILVAGPFGYEEVLIKQYTKNGLPDYGFGNNGLVRMKVKGTINYPTYLVSFLQQPTGKSTLLWNSYSDLGSDVVVRQYYNSGVLQEEGPGNSLRIRLTPFYTEAGALTGLGNEILISGIIRDTVASQPFVIRLKEIIPKPFIIQDGNQVSTQPGYTTYHWFVNGMGIAGNNSNNFKPSQNGIIKVTVTNSDGCTNTSQEYNHLVLATKDIFIGNTKLVYYPNPAHSILNIDMLEPASNKIKAELYEPGGKLVHHQILNQLSNQISIRHLPAGVYQLRLKNGNESISAKIVLIK